jgi:hypothetical protein
MRVTVLLLFFTDVCRNSLVRGIETSVYVSYCSTVPALSNQSTIAHGHEKYRLKCKCRNS